MVILIANYLITHYKGTYRVKCPYNQASNTFSRDLKGNYEDIDCYIDCNKNVKVFYYGRSTLQAYIPSITYGRNIIRIIYSKYINPKNTTVEDVPVVVNGVKTTRTKYTINDKELFKKDIRERNNIIFDIEETNEEVLFKFKVSNDKTILPLLNPKTSGASISPFSTKNLPKSNYIIPDKELSMYTNISKNIPKENLLNLTHTTNRFLHELFKTQKKYDEMKSDMAFKCMKSKEYIHSIGKWCEYIKYLKENL